MRRAIGIGVACMVLAACGPADDDRPIDVSVIGAAPRLADRARPPVGATAALLTDATAQGLVAFDAAGQIEPALADRWIVAGDGLSLIFRLDAPDDDRPVPDAGVIARHLRRAIAAPANPLRPVTGAIDEIAAVTPQVIEVRLSSPRPNLLQLLAQPEFGILRGTEGAGPWSARVTDGVATLRPPAPPEDIAPEPPVRLRGERAALAVARFAAGRTDGVLGGTILDLPVARAANPGPALRFDPAPGLFGLVFAAAAQGPAADPVIRRALAMAIDRDALGTALAIPGWRGDTAIVPAGIDDLPRVARPDWDGLSLADRRTAAAAAIARWRTDHPGDATFTLALPPGPGARLLLTRIAADWAAIGVGVRAAAAGEAADIGLIDLVAPADIASWYLRHFACERGVPCTTESDTALIAARRAPTLAERAVLLREADRLIAATVPFIPLGRPVRWSLVGPRLDGWRESPRAFHPLRHLRR